MQKVEQKTGVEAAETTLSKTEAQELPAATPTIKPTIEHERDLGRFKVSWGKDPKAFSIFEFEGSGVRVSDLFRGAQPKGSGGTMLADALKAAQISREKVNSLEWRRSKVLELSSQGHSQPEIARILQS